MTDAELVTRLGKMNLTLVMAIREALPLVRDPRAFEILLGAVAEIQELDAEPRA